MKNVAGVVKTYVRQIERITQKSRLILFDRTYDNLKLCRDSGWGTPSKHPDLVPFRKRSC